MAKRCPSEWPAPLWVSHPKILVPLNYSFSGLGLLPYFKDPAIISFHARYALLRSLRSV